MRTVILDSASSGLDELLERRRRAGLDRLDEVWQGELHMIPAPSFEHAEIATQLARLLGPAADQAGLTIAMHEFNIGESEHDFRVPDGGLFRGRPRGVWLRTAALVAEILSPGDETWAKLDFYAAHDVDEVLIVDLATRAVHWLSRTADGYRPVARSGLIDMGADDLRGRLRWPSADADAD